MSASDFLVIGGGIVGLSVAHELKRRFGDARVTVLDKEPSLGRHASGRNSGVIHAGFYYSADSLKARFTRQGNQELREYCLARALPLNDCGKLVVAQDEQELAVLDTLFERGRSNDVPLEMVDEATAAEIEPRARVLARALWSPTTATADPLAVLEAMRLDAVAEGVEIRTGEGHAGRVDDTVRTTRGARLPFGYLVNCAGLHADRVAQDFGHGEDYCILPFKGLYLRQAQGAPGFRTNIYPVPNLRNPFLGVHVTVTVDGHVKLGPTAIPALWREQYGGFAGFRVGELAEILSRTLGLFAHSGFEFRRLAFEELRKHRRRHLVRLSQSLATGLEASQFRKWGKPGIRAQLLHRRERKLEMDFVVQGDAESMHVLNAVSPGWTCSLPFSRYVCDRIQAEV